MRYRKIIAITLSMILFMKPMTVFAKSTELTEKQKETASKVAEVVSGNWEEYGVLPSVAVAQTFVESSLGVNQVRKNNLWGLRPGGEYSSYRNLNDGIHAYLKVLNNGLYDKALHKKNYKLQLQKILEGGTTERMTEERTRNIAKIVLIPSGITTLNDMTRSYLSVYTRRKSINA